VEGLTSLSAHVSWPLGLILALFLQNQLREYQRALNKVRQRADELEDENVDLTQDLNALQHKVGCSCLVDFSIFLCRARIPPFV